MNKKTAGLLIGAGAGAGLVWAARRGLIDFFPPQNRYIVLEDDNGTCRVTTKPAELYLVRKQKVTWHITNHCPYTVDVSLANWKDKQGLGKQPPVDPDHEGEGSSQGELSATVQANGTGRIKAKAKTPSVILETFFYDIYIDGKLGADPIVKLVL
jgi:hypothetical protein